MQTMNPFVERYRPLKTSITDTSVLAIDTEACPQAILDAAHQRIRASSDLLETLYCLCFNQADIKALYLLTQDGCDLLEVAQQRMLNWKAPS
ncbi:hypothetical protein [Pseudomonas fluorescens]|uniref:Short-chain dehydrogenase n=1 Tax=Pseudomonas fluorescens TaxID=294 RepID=A0A5E7BIC4_PSEFL|nr:hypothetical protein [Pseudomonas fluorescens]VVN84813.1 hypothetical protein PS691_01379 [Pseudomonas fluorescens]